MTTPSQHPRSFYRRLLPSTCVPLSSKDGRSIFSSASSHSGLKSFFPLVEQHSTQSEPAFCGITTLVVILNALSVDPRRTWKGAWRWYEESMLNCCLDLEEVKRTGITIPNFHCLAVCQGLTSTCQYASRSSVKEFRAAVREVCITTASFSDECCGYTFLVVSYGRKAVGQTGGGHFSPIAAYDEISDMVLVLDVARFKYGAHWMPLQLMFEAMLLEDKDTGMSRGYFLLSYDVNEEYISLPISVLFRSKKAQDSVRRTYKNFLKENLNDGKIDLKEVVTFWTKDGKDNDFVWEMFTPQQLPVNEQEKNEIDSVLTQLQALLSRYADFDLRTPNTQQKTSSSQCTISHKSTSNRCCIMKNHRKSNAREIDITSFEAMFIIYLASLSLEYRKEVAKIENSDDDAMALEQLLSEAEAISIAIEMSDQS